MDSVPPNPRTRYGMAAGLAGMGTGIGLILVGRFTSMAIALAGAGLFGVCIVLAITATVVDAYLLRRHGVGWSVPTTIVLVLLTGPIWVAIALWRRDAWRGVDRSFVERVGRAVEDVRK